MPDLAVELALGHRAGATGITAIESPAEPHPLPRLYYQFQAASERDWRIVSSPARPPFADRFREWARRALALGLPIDDESLCLELALALGWKTALTEEVSEPFVQAATNIHFFFLQTVNSLRIGVSSGFNGLAVC